MIAVKEFAHTSHCSSELIGLRKHYNSEVVRLFPVEAAAGNKKNVCCMEKIPCELLIVGDVEFLYIELREEIKSSTVFNEADTVNFFKL